MRRVLLRLDASSGPSPATSRVARRHCGVTPSLLSSETLLRIVEVSKQALFAFGGIWHRHYLGNSEIARVLSERWPPHDGGGLYDR